jgi:hypothetical protein
MRWRNLPPWPIRAIAHQQPHDLRQMVCERLRDGEKYREITAATDQIIDRLRHESVRLILLQRGQPCVSS